MIQSILLISFKKKKILFSLLLTLFVFGASAQELILLKGKVSSEGDGELMPGVNIKIKNSQGGTTTGVDGTYSLRVTRGVTLVFSFVGYTPKEVIVGKSNVINVLLKNATVDLGEVIVTGYGGTVNTLEKTGAFSRVTNAEFKTTTVNGVDQILQGRTAGVNVISTSGEPGADIIVNLRGIGSISGDNQPLYVIDGFPVPATATAASGQVGGSRGNGLVGLNPNDIESIDILKDASATAIYGSRAANGVILITTKKGKTGESVIEVTNKTGLTLISSPYQMMNSQQYVDTKNRQSTRTGNIASFNVEDFANRKSTNWLKELTQPGLRQEIALNFRGGVGATNYYLSATYLTEKGIVINSGNKKGSLRLNLNTEVKKWYNIKTQIAYTKQDNAVAITRSRGWPGGGGPILNALRGSPVLEYNPDEEDSQADVIDGVTISGTRFVNPVLEQRSKLDNSYLDEVIANLDNTIFLNPKRTFEFHAIGGLSYKINNRKYLIPSITDPGNGGTAFSRQDKNQSYNLALTLTNRYKKDKHNLTNLLGLEYNAEMFESFSATGRSLDYPEFALDNLASAKTQTVSSGKSEAILQSAFGRSTYNYDNRYIFNGSLRLDGSSKLAENKKFGLFPSASFAWNLSEESFIKDNIPSISLAKLRASYGSSANNRGLPSNRSLGLYGATFYENIASGNPDAVLVPIQARNPDLTWESSNIFNVAIDLGFLRNKLNVTFDYYNKITQDLLQNVPVAAQSGFSNIWANVGTIRNRGVELTINSYQVTTKNFNWSSNFNISHNKTILIDLGNFDPFAATNIANLGGNLVGGASHVLIPGREIGLFYGFKVDGLYQLSDFEANGTTVKSGVPVLSQTVGTPDTRVGRLKFVNTNGSEDNLVDDKDRTVLGDAAPIFTYGITNNFKYKRLSLSILLQGSYGNTIQNQVNAYISSGNLASIGTAFNQTQDWYFNQWTLNNQHNDVRYPAVQTAANVVTTAATSAQMEDGSYLRMKNVTLQYSFNVSKFKFMRSFNLFLTGTDLLTITNYSGFDPEASSYGTDIRLQGIDYGAYPRARNFTLGLTAAF